MAEHAKQLIYDAYLELAEKSIADITEVGCPDAFAQCESPIETLFLYGVWALAIRERYGLRVLFKDANIWLPVCCGHGDHCIWLTPQWEYSGRRYDFRLAVEHQANTQANTQAKMKHGLNDVAAGVLIECDGHDFHERTKEQARRDKRRDREAAAHGMVVLRYAGSEIYANAVECASDSVRIAGGRPVHV